MFHFFLMLYEPNKKPNKKNKHFKFSFHKLSSFSEWDPLGKVLHRVTDYFSLSGLKALKGVSGCSSK